MNPQDSKTVTRHTAVAASMAREGDPLIGTKVKNRYLIKKELESGGFGAVYLAEDQTLVGRLVVIKVLSKKLHRDNWAVNKFKHEIEALTRIDHPAIVGVLDAGEMPDGSPFLVMQYVKGVTLRHVMNGDGMDFERAAALISQIGQGLDAAHEKGIIHRDLKPENIMLQKVAGGEQVKIIDFGIAKVRDSQVAPSTQVTTIAGTIAYMAPEQLNGQSVSCATDIYTLAAIAYEMLTGRKPFNPETQFQLVGMQRDGVKIKPRDLRPGLPEAAERVLLKALSYNVGDRYPIARSFTDSLSAALLESGLIPRHADSNAKTIMKTSVLKVRKNRRNVILVASAVVIIAALIGLKMFSRRSVKATDQPTAVASPLTNSVATRTLDYSLSIQKMRNGQPFEKPYDVTGSAILENGYGVRVNLASHQEGYLYLINEGPGANNAITYNLLFPMPSMNGGSARLEAGQKQSTVWYQLDQHQGTEKFWIVWSANAIPEIEAVKGVVNPRQKGTITDPVQADALRAFLAKHSTVLPEIETDETQNVNHLTAKGDVLVNLLKLVHR